MKTWPGKYARTWEYPSLDAGASMNIRTIIVATIILTVCGLAAGADWPMWGGSPSRNMVSTEKGLLTDFSPGKYKKGSELIDPSTTKNIKWVVKMGSQTYGNPTVANGRVYVGTNN